VPRGRINDGFAALATIAAVTAAPATGAAAGWSLIGGGDQYIPVVASLGEGRLLACTSKRCDTWDLAPDAWTTAGGSGIALSSGYVLVHLREGSLLLPDAGPGRSAVWSRDGNGWRDAPLVPRFMGTPQVQAMTNGRVIIAGNTLTGRRAYVADPQVTAWSLLAEPPAEARYGDLLVARSGLFAVVESNERIRLWHLDAPPDRWVELPLPGWQGGTERLVVPWNAEVLLVATRSGGHREALMVAGRPHTHARQAARRTERVHTGRGRLPRTRRPARAPRGFEAVRLAQPERAASRASA
jgi:hypothetical protein